METSLKSLILSLRSIYGARNDKRLCRVTERVAYLLCALYELEGLHRKHPQLDYAPYLAGVFARMACLIDAEGDQGIYRFVQAVTAKYAFDCAYCQTSPCTYPKKGPRPNPQGREDAPSGRQEWSLRDFQKHLERLYGARNRAHSSMENAMLRLFAESAEVLKHTLMRPSRGAPPLPNEYYEEAADTLAWLIAIANLLQIDLEEAVRRTYANVCTACHQAPCNCPL